MALECNPGDGGTVDSVVFRLCHALNSILDSLTGIIDSEIGSATCMERVSIVV